LLLGLNLEFSKAETALKKQKSRFKARDAILHYETSESQV